MKRTVNFIAGLVLATFAVKTGAHLPQLIATPGVPAGLVFLLLAWTASAAWGALVLMARSDR